MKKIFLIITLLFAVISGFSQVRIGYSAEEIKEEFTGTEEGIDVRYTDDGKIYYVRDFPSVKFIYLFNEDKICHTCVVVPLTEGALNTLVENYNKNFVIISDTKWKWYNENGIAEIELVFDAKLGTHFIWK